MTVLGVESSLEGWAIGSRTPLSDFSEDDAFSGQYTGASRMMKTGQGMQGLLELPFREPPGEATILAKDWHFSFIAHSHFIVAMHDDSEMSFVVSHGPR